jgi:hypothetical protein
MLAIARLGGVGGGPSSKPAIIKVRDKIEPTHRAVNQKADEAVTGTADVLAPTVKISRPRIALPEVGLRPTAQIEAILTVA